MTESELWEHLGEFLGASTPLFTFIAFLYMIVYVRDRELKRRRINAKDHKATRLGVETRN